MVANTGRIVLMAIGKMEQRSDMNLQILEKIFSQISPIEVLKIIFTPENVEAASYGATKAFLESKKNDS